MRETPSSRRQALLEHYEQEVARRREQPEYRSSLYGSRLDPLPDSIRPYTFGCSHLIDLLQVEEGQAILDLGCGGGLDLLLAGHELGDRVRRVGVDPSPHMIRLARENTEAVGLSNVSLVEGDAFSIPLNLGPFDWVISNAVLNLIPERVPVLRRILRLMGTDGKVVIGDVVIRGRIPRLLAEAPPTASSLLLFRNLPVLPDYLDSFFEAGFEAVQSVSLTPLNPQKAILAAARHELNLSAAHSKELERRLARVQFLAVTLVATPVVGRIPRPVFCCGLPLLLEHIPSIHLTHAPMLERLARQAQLNTTCCPRCHRKVPTPDPYVVFDEYANRVYHVFPESAHRDRALLEREVARFHEDWVKGTGLTQYTAHLVFGPDELARAVGPLL